MLDTILDKSVVGYTALGYRWRPHPIIDTDLTGRVAVVTGATSGLGRQTASELARLGASVILVGRNPEKTDAVVESIRRETGNSKLLPEIADLSEMEQVRALAGRIEAPVHILVNNAGVLLPERTETREGFETSFATNLLGHFLLTNLLIDKLEAPARIVNVSSGGMYTQRIRVDDLQMERGRYDGAVAYARAKRGQVILTELWADALRDARGRGSLDAPGLGRHPRGLRFAAAVLQAHQAAAAHAGAGRRHNRVALRLGRCRAVYRPVLARSKATADTSVSEDEGNARGARIALGSIDRAQRLVRNLGRPRGRRLACRHGEASKARSDPTAPGDHVDLCAVVAVAHPAEPALAGAWACWSVLSVDARSSF